MAWITVKTPEGISVSFNTRNILAVVDPPSGEEEDSCGVITVGRRDRAVTVEGPREALIRKIIHAEWDDRYIRADVQRRS